MDLFTACLENNYPRVLALLNGGADVNMVVGNMGDIPIHVAIHANANEIVTLLVERGADIMIFNTIGQTPLHSAAWLDNSAIIKLLLSAGADVDAKSTTGVTPLHMANRKDIILLLLTAGANINAQTLKGNTMLHDNVRQHIDDPDVDDDIDHIRFLLDHGASTDVRNKAGKTALDLAQNEAIKTILLEHIASQGVKNAGRRK